MSSCRVRDGGGGSAEKVLFVALYFSFNATLNLFNRWALHTSGFHFPIVMTACHMLMSTVMLLPLFTTGHYGQRHTSVMSSRRVVRDVAVVGVLHGLQIALNNASLVHLELSMNQVVRAMLPVVIAPFAMCIEGKAPDARQAVALVFVSVGVAIALFDRHSMGGSPLGVGLVVLSLVMLAAQMSFASKMLQGLRLDSVQMTFYTGPVAFVALVPFALVLGEAHAAVRLTAERPALCAYILLGGSAVAVLYNMIVYHTLRLFSSVGAAVVGNAKVVVLILVAHLVLGEVSNWSRMQVFGSALTLGSAFAYAYLKTSRLNAAPDAAAERLRDPCAPASDEPDADEKRARPADEDGFVSASAASSVSGFGGAQVAPTVSCNARDIDLGADALAGRKNRAEPGEAEREGAAAARAKREP
ncbi:hypothetical protein KFE25_012492 [Diacronema lutheri]|uniref:Sugar phosphate transporter domain-containing protein n=1 Tax=Diacronema lutheri TaxID=2081491 RepID=A0A8J6CA28_DIALT|nr:hypothetical protein KFE25_012492 [Diacronema lutheri]